MNVKEFKMHLMRGLMRPEYFYIPILYKEDKSGIYIEIFDENGNHFEINNLTISYRTFQFYHLIRRNDDGTYTTIIDETNKGYAFDADTEWRYEVPNPSQWEILHLPDFTQNPPTIDGGNIENVGQQFVKITFPERHLIELKNIPAGIYQISFKANNVDSTSYYPDYYNDYQSPYYVSHNYGNCMVDRNGKFSGFNYYMYSHPQYGFPNGYDFYCITQKFLNNTMPVVVTRKHNVRLVVFMADVPFYSDVVFCKNRNELLITNYDYYSFQTYMRSYEIVKTQELFIPGKVPAVKIYIDGEYKGYITTEFRIRYSQHSVTTSIETDQYNRPRSYQNILSNEIGVSPYTYDKLVIQHSESFSSNGDLQVFTNDSDMVLNSILTNRYNERYKWDDFVYITKETKNYQKNIVSAFFNSRIVLISLTDNIDCDVDYYESIPYTYTEPEGSEYHTEYGKPGDQNKLEDSYISAESVDTPLSEDINGYVELWDEHSVDRISPKTIEELQNMHDGAYTNIVKKYVYMEGMTAAEYANYINQMSHSEVTVEIEQV